MVDSGQRMPPYDNYSINIAAELSESMANGPGKRYVIWVQGCCFKCPGCFNSAFQPIVPKNIVPVDIIARRILSVKSIEGVTYSGGEPILQCDALVELNNILIKNDLSIVCYTGYTLEELYQLNNSKVIDFLSQIDILIDGRYQEANKTNLIWRGSRNQKVHFLTDRYKEYQALTNSNGEIELIIGNDKNKFTGILQEEILRRLNDRMKKGLK